MPGRVEGKVAFITGAARGQGRSHAIRLAQEGADIIAIDIAAQIDTVPYPMATPEDLAETVRQVESLGRKIVATRADVRDYEAVKAAVDDGVAQFGRLDIVVSNAGIASYAPIDQISEASWKDMIDVQLNGMWHVAKASIPHLRSTGGGSIILTSSDAGLYAIPNGGHYNSAKHGVAGLMKTLALELAPDNIRANTLHPCMVDTPMIDNEAIFRLFRPDLKNPTKEDLTVPAMGLNALPIPWVEAVDISNAVLWLASDEARYVTGAELPIDAGSNLKN
ncbi:MAG TPA: SDR family mycofactocin-dependent oxidoreductase [Gordonia polyisoprenivorans]|nr:SDR family mycofactocin-dependent oxidoreductase [Gordonia polyisoprenivorans]